MNESREDAVVARIIIRVISRSINRSRTRKLRTIDKASSVSDWRWRRTTACLFVDLFGIYTRGGMDHDRDRNRGELLMRADLPSRPSLLFASVIVGRGKTIGQ